MESANPKVESGVKESPSPASGGLVYVRRRAEVNQAPKALVSSSAKSPEEPSSHRRLGWEERYHQLQMLLNKLNESDQKDHVQMLWSLSSAELSKHAVELEKRSIQFSLEEAREMQRVAALNVLGRSVATLKSTSNDGE